MKSEFASWMNRYALDYPDKVEGIPKDQDEVMGLLAEKGNLHEAIFLEKLIHRFGSENVAVIDVPKHEAYQATLDAMEKGYQVIFQAYLQRDEFAGYADFLVRRDDSGSAFGSYYYEAWDTKLSKSTRPYFLIQLCCYSWMLEAIQGVVPFEAAVILGDNSEDRFRIVAQYSYFLSLKKRFLDIQSSFKGDLSTRPDPALESEFGVWGTYAKELCEESDSLALIANIRKTQIQKLYKLNISTLTELAQTTLTHVQGISPETFERLRAQARIQNLSKGSDRPKFEVLKTDNGKGLSALPPPSKLDVFFDIEGHPIVDGGLEYLWGCSYNNPDATQGKNYAFIDWWAHDSKQEKTAFEGFIDWVYARWQQEPNMHVYHYATYEITAIRKLSTRNQTRLEEVAELLSNGVFIDLYKVVRGGLLIGEQKYSIKNVEHLYRGKRTTDVANGGESIVVYESWREQGGAEKWLVEGYADWLAHPDDFDWSAWPILNDIRDYNIDDCESTLELYEWLIEQQTKANIKYEPLTQSENEKEKSERQQKNQEKREALKARQQALIDMYESDDALKVDKRAKILVDLLHFYERERKPQLWSYFDRLEKSDEELFDDDTVLFNLDLLSTNYDESKLICTATYDLNQPVRTDKVQSAVVQGTDVSVNKIKFNEHNTQLGEVSFEIAADQELVLQQPQLTLLGNESRINTDTLENRLCDITEQYFERGKLSGVIETILDQSFPKFTEGSEALPVSRQYYPDDLDYMNAVVAAIEAMDNTCLCIQGPPGAGKTYTAKHVIEALVNDGKRVGIMSNSHAAIMNLLKALPELLPNAGLVKVGGYDSLKEFREHYPDFDYPNLDFRNGMSFTKKKPYENYDVVGATVYGFAKQVAYDSPLDYLFVDEASQVALANLIAVSGAAKNIILMGDQMQLEQPIQGSHPDDASKSALEFMLQDHSVIPEDQGIFLERTYRMHPAVCQPLSEVVYEGRLKADSLNINQTIQIPNPELVSMSNGIMPIKVQHEGNTQSSEEEVAIIKRLIAELKTGLYTDKTSKKHRISDADILVVAPYNMQVNLLKENLSDTIKVGTIDKFQGQEAPVVIISMAVSDVEESSRGLDFVFDINRLNVAMSRAKALAIIVSNEGLEHCSVNSLGQMEKVGFYSKLIGNELNG